MIWVLHGWEYVKSAMTRRLIVSSYPVGMLELVKDVLPESRTLVNLVPTVGKVSQQLIVSTCDTVYCESFKVEKFCGFCGLISTTKLFQ